MIRKGFKVEIKPTEAQLVLLKKSAGVARFTYNWALNLVNEFKTLRKDAIVRPNAMALHRLLNSKKKAEFPWMYEVSKCCAQSALQNLERAFKSFWKDCKKPKEQRRFKYPQFKKKNSIDSFKLEHAISGHMKGLKATSRTLTLPRIGVVKLIEYGRIPSGTYTSVSVSRQADRWFVSVWKEVELPQTETTDGTVGIDLGIKALAVLSTGEQFQSPKRTKQRTNKLKRLQRKLSRQKKGSNKRNKTKNRVAKEYYKQTCQRRDCIHKLTSYLTKTKSERTLVIEDLNVEGMKKNRSLARAVSEVGFGTFRRFLEYKCKWYGKELVIADRWFPWSKRCSSCGLKNQDLTLKDRTWTCSCGATHGRDLNAALNLQQYPEFQGNWKQKCFESPQTDSCVKTAG